MQLVRRPVPAEIAPQKMPQQQPSVRWSVSESWTPAAPVLPTDSETSGARRNRRARLVGAQRIGARSGCARLLNHGRQRAFSGMSPMSLAPW